MNLTIIFDLPYYTSEGKNYLLFGSSGYVTQIIELAKYFEQVNIYAPKIQKDLIDSTEEISIKNISFLPLSEGVHNSFVTFIKSFFVYRKAIKKIIEDNYSDCFTTFLPGSFIGIVAGYYIRKSKVKSFFRVTAYLGSGSKTYPIGKKILYFIFIPIANIFLKYIVSNQLVFFSGKKTIKAPGEHYAIVSSSFDDDIIRYRSTACMGDDYRILYVGAFDELKGVKYLVHAFKEFLEEGYGGKLILVGKDWGSGSENSIRKLVYDLNIEQKVFFQGWIPFGPELFKEYIQADMLVFPSLGDIQGKVTLEAMAFGTPVIASDIGGVSSIVKNNETGILVPPGNSHKIFEAMKLVVEDRGFRERIVRGGYAMAKASTLKHQINFMLQKISQRFDLNVR